MDAAFSTTSGSIPSPSLRNIRRADRASSQKIGTATTKPATGSTQDCPNAAPTPAATTAREVSASVRACLPSVISASEPMDSPTRIRYRATNPSPIAPTMPAAITHGISSIRRASKRRCADSQMTRPARDCNSQDNEESSPIFGPIEPVRVPFGGGPTANSKGDPQRNCRQRIGEIVKGICQQGHRPADHHNHSLDQGSDAKTNQRDLGCPDSDGPGVEICRCRSVVMVVCYEMAHTMTDPPKPACSLVISVAVIAHPRQRYGNSNSLASRQPVAAVQPDVLQWHLGCRFPGRRKRSPSRTSPCPGSGVPHPK